MASVLSEIPHIVAVLQKGAAFEAGQPITIPIAAASYTLNLPEVGNVQISESGTTVTIKKV